MQATFRDLARYCLKLKNSNSRKGFPLVINCPLIFSGKHCWLLNTVRNVKVLERHVGKEVHDYMKERDSGTDDQVVSPHYVESQNLLEQQQLPEGTRKVSNEV